MTKKLLGVFTAIVTALAVVGVAWAGTDAATSTSNSAKTSTGASLAGSSHADSSGLAAEAALDASTSATVDSSTSATVDDDRSSSTSTNVDTSTSTSADATTSTSVDDDDDQSTTSTSSTTSTTVDDDDDDDRIVVPDGITTHIIPGVGTVTIEAAAGQLFLVSVSAPGWEVENEKLEADRIELEFTNEVDAEAEFEARIQDGRIEVRIEVDSD